MVEAGQRKSRKIISMTEAAFWQALDKEKR